MKLKKKKKKKRKRILTRTLKTKRVNSIIMLKSLKKRMHSDYTPRT